MGTRLHEGTPNPPGTGAEPGEPGIYPGQNAPEIPKQPEPEQEIPPRRGTPERELPEEPATQPGHEAPEIQAPEAPQHDAPPVLH